jgi:dephospho-CoA kinase
MHVLLTGMSGTGKSTLVRELQRRGYTAQDADDDGFTEPRANGRWGWRTDAVSALLERTSGLLFFAGCSEEQRTLPFDYRVLLTAPRSLLITRLRERTTNTYASDGAELANVLTDIDEVEPLLRRSADLVLDTTRPPEQLADQLLERVTAFQNAATHRDG